MSAHAYRHNCGCSDCCRDETDAEAIDGILSEFWKDDEKLRSAEEWTAGGHSGLHYSQVSITLARLHRTHPADLMGSNLLTELYRLAKVEHDAIDGVLSAEAAEEYNRLTARPDDLGVAA